MKAVLLIICFLFSSIHCDYLSIEAKRKITSKPVIERKFLNLKLINNSTIGENEIPNQKDIGSEISTTEEHPQFSKVELTNYLNVQYYGEVYIGTPNKKYSVIFDTGSNILWLPGENCDLCRSYSKKYNPTKSSTSVDLNIEKNITFAVGFVNGHLYEDKIVFNPNKGFLISSKKELSAKNYRILSINSEKNLTGTQADGVLGLGIHDENNVRNSLVKLLYEQKKITSPSFSFYLLDQKNKGTISRLYIGDILNNKYIFNLFKNNISQCYVPYDFMYWECQVTTGILFFDSINKTSSKFESKSTVIFDTGSSYTLLPKNDFEIIFSYFQANHNCLVDQESQLLCQCNNIYEFGYIELYFDSDNKFKIDLAKLIDYDKRDLFQCHFQIMEDAFEINTWVLGDSALRHSLISFDMDERKISFVQNIQDIIDENKLAKSSIIFKEGGFFSSILFWVIIAVIILALAFVVAKLIL